MTDLPPLPEPGFRNPDDAYTADEMREYGAACAAAYGAEIERLRQQSESLARAVMCDMGNQREPLTEQQINDLVRDVHLKCGHLPPTPMIIVRAIERAHGIGEQK